VSRDFRFPDRPSPTLAKAAAVREVEAKAAFFTPATAAFEFGMSGMRAPGSNVDYATDVRNGMYSSVITSALSWVMRTFPEAPCIVQRRVEKRWDEVDGHDLTKLLRKPNPRYGGRVLWMATAMDFCFGEAFWLKIRDGNRKVVELWWVPRALITPQPDPHNPGDLSHYVYTPGHGSQLNLELSDVVHFRFGMDPANIFRGFSPLAAVMREVYIDDAAAGFTAAILKNLGIIGVIFSPKGGTIPPDQAEKLKAYVQANFTGEKRAQAMMFTNEMNAQLLQYNLQGFDVGPIRDIVEERVSAALAIPAAVIGFGTGLQQTKVGATMREMVKLAWQGGIEPNQAIMADELDRSLLPEFQKNDDLFRTHFDTSQVEALTESPTERATRLGGLVRDNIVKVNEARQEMGYASDPSVDKYARELMPAAPASDPPPRPSVDSNTPPATDDATSGKSITIEGPTVNVPATPVHLAFTIEAPRAGMKRVGTMERINGKLVVETTDVTDEIPAGHSSSNGDGTHVEP
jgi:HK97 family phage portal protein